MTCKNCEAAGGKCPDCQIHDMGYVKNDEVKSLIEGMQKNVMKQDAGGADTADKRRVFSADDLESHLSSCHDGECGLHKFADKITMDAYNKGIEMGKKLK